jgi:two-component system CheB/CheR fusion protein
VLVVDDNRDGAQSLRLVLELHGHEVAVACDGAEAVALARAFRPTVVVCDLSLPVMDGFEVARELRRSMPGERPCLVALSGHTLPDDVRRALEAGFDHHLAKPPDMERLQALIAQAG